MVKLAAGQVQTQKCINQVQINLGYLFLQGHVVWLPTVPKVNRVLAYLVEPQLV